MCAAEVPISRCYAFCQSNRHHKWRILRIRFGPRNRYIVVTVRMFAFFIDISCVEAYAHAIVLCMSVGGVGCGGGWAWWVGMCVVCVCVCGGGGVGGVVRCGCAVWLCVCGVGGGDGLCFRFHRTFSATSISHKHRARLLFASQII